ncbi:DUF2631 domain-containing protein [Cryptosporangium phraense]|uniref:DUF2631 domain-containing protein n=1 Tax=Cryptosporangium phraense TaxID=2593070 RepID=A0A545AKC0_9ACTN|nr:DUF2631 domain-containing protein [Cryptosporangium phraense]TQS41739.1 DUF2631 domain-containing protein [Cryptosporangium phraense]
MAEEEPVIAPDQLREGHPKLWRGLAVVSAVALLIMVVGNHQGHVEDLFLIGGAVIILVLLAWDAVQRRYGVKR